MTPAPWEGRNVVYRLLNSHGLCIYVGCTRSLITRVWGHQQNSHFGAEIDRVQVTIHGSREAALEFETSEIRRLRPRYNINGRGRRFTWLPVDFIEVLEECERRIATGTDQRGGTGRSALDLDNIRADFDRRFPRIARLAASGRVNAAVAS